MAWYIWLIILLIFLSETICPYPAILARSSALSSTMLEMFQGLEDLPQAQQARQMLSALRPAQPDLSGWQPYATDDQTTRTPADWQVSFDAHTAAITQLERGSAVWAGPENPLGWLRYQTFSAADYDRFFRQYILEKEWHNGWSREDFTKPGIEGALPLSRFWQPQAKEGFTRVSGSQQEFLFHLVGEELSVQEYGCPRDFWLHYSLDASTAIQLELQWFHKPASRLPEALWFSFVPLLPQTGEWKIEKMGQEISPAEVVPDGNRHLHASGQYVRWSGRNGKLQITSLDAPLVAPGKPSLLDFNNDLYAPELGMHFNLLNNMWGTNFPMWFEEDCRFRFTLMVEPPQS